MGAVKGFMEIDRETPTPRPLDDFAARIRQHETLGIFTIGGGVPRNWAQQVGPYLEILRTRLGSDEPVS